MVGDIRRRLKIASLACFGALALALLSHLVLVRLGRYPLQPAHVAACLVTMVLSVGLYFAFGWRRLTLGQLVNLALFAEFQLCFSVSMMELRGPDPRSLDRFGVSLVGVILVLAPSLIPCPPLKTLLVALACAATGPAALHHTFPNAPASAYFNLYAVSFVCAGLALAPTFVLMSLRSELSDAVELGSYRLLEQLGSGGMGEVWRAQHRLLVRPAAIKLIGSELAPDPVVRQRFEQEVQATAQLRCPHTVTVYDYGTADDGTFYYVMELLEGLDMARLVEQQGPLAPARVCHLLDQVLQSLQEAHEAGLVHRDIKPENVYVLPGDFVKVLDFGLALSVSLPADSRLSSPETVQGTPAFMAPEQALQKDLDARADLYATACLGHWLLTGRTLFPADSPVAHIIAHVSDQPQASGLHGELDALLLECLAKDPGERPASARELRRRLPLRGAWTEEEAARAWLSPQSSSSNS